MSEDLDSLFELNASANPHGQPPSGFDPAPPSPGGKLVFAASALTRYRDAYLVARVTTGFGSIIKGIGIVIAVVIFGGAATVADQLYSSAKTQYMLTGFVTAVIVGAVFYLFGILVSAQGQILKASLDSAVHSSPFMNDNQKAEVMSLGTR